MTKTMIYEPELGLDGTIPELVDWAERYTSDYSDPALERISELAKTFKLDDKLVQIPLLLRDERKREYEKPDTAPYERMKIDYLETGKCDFARSNYGAPGTELEIRSENDVVLISLIGIDEYGSWHAENAVSVQDFMSNEGDWLENVIGETYYYGKEYNID